MPSSSFVRAFGLTLALGLGACGSVALSPDAGSTGVAGQDGGGTGSAGTSGGAGTTGHAGTSGAGTTGHAGTGGGAGTTGAAGTGGGSCICPAIYAPVCGTDGKTYGSKCEATCVGAVVAHDGECATSTTINFQLVVPAGKSFCDHSEGCSGERTHIQILPTGGQAFTLAMGSCTTTCAACQPVACPTVCQILHDQAFTDAEISWDGTVYKSTTCGGGIGCVSASHVPAGKYIARMCATPGTLGAADGGVQSLPTCTGSGVPVCVDVPFDYPGTSPVVGHLP